jgi:RNA polymerase sigma factor (sigma-70 family)
LTKPRSTRQTLLIKIRDQHDDAAWQDFVQFYRPYVYRVIQNLQVAASDREDIIQEVMLIAWQQLPSFDYDPGKGRFRSWLCTIVQRTTRKLRDRKARGEVFADAVTAADLAAGVDPEIEAIAQLEWERHVSDMAWANVSQRFEPQVLAAFKALVSGQSGETVAGELGLSSNSVYVYKKRVLAALRKEIAYLADELG